MDRPQNKKQGKIKNGSTEPTNPASAACSPASAASTSVSSKQALSPSGRSKSTQPAEPYLHSTSPTPHAITTCAPLEPTTFPPSMLLPQASPAILVAGLGCQPPAGLLADAAPVEAIPRTLSPQQESRQADSWAAYCLLAKSASGLITIGAENLICHRGGRGAMAERARVSETTGIPSGLDARDHIEVRAAGNAVCVPVAHWIAQHLMEAF